MLNELDILNLNCSKFWPAFGCYLLQTLVKLWFFMFLHDKCHKGTKRRKNEVSYFCEDAPELTEGLGDGAIHVVFVPLEYFDQLRLLLKAISLMSNTRIFRINKSVIKSKISKIKLQVIYKRMIKKVQYLYHTAFGMHNT